MNDSVGWSWSISFRTIEYTPLILLIFTLCPLSIVVAFQIQTSNIDQPAGISPLTARSVWKYTSSRALKVLIIPILFIVITELSRHIYLLISLLFPRLPVSYDGIPLVLLHMFVNIYFLVTLSLYNQCIMFENRSIIDIFKRSHSLVRGVRLKYLSIYLLTAGGSCHRILSSYGFCIICSVFLLYRTCSNSRCINTTQISVSLYWW